MIIKYNMHDHSMECEIEENLSLQKELEGHPDLPLIAAKLKNYLYSVELEFQWSEERKELIRIK